MRGKVAWGTSRATYPLGRAHCDLQHPPGLCPITAICGIRHSYLPSRHPTVANLSPNGWEPKGWVGRIPGHSARRWFLPGAKWLLGSNHLALGVPSADLSVGNPQNRIFNKQQEREEIATDPAHQGQPWEWCTRPAPETATTILYQQSFASRPQCNGPPGWQGSGFPGPCPVHTYYVGLAQVNGRAGGQRRDVKSIAPPTPPACSQLLAGTRAQTTCTHTRAYMLACSVCLPNHQHVTHKL